VVEVHGQVQRVTQRERAFVPKGCNLVAETMMAAGAAADGVEA
jgi:hypothetical protein